MTKSNRAAKSEGPAEQDASASGSGDDGAWFLDSQIPAAEQLSGLPETAEAPLETPELDDTEEQGAGASLEAEPPMVDLAAARPRSKTVSRKQMLRERRRLMQAGLLPEVIDYERPVSRSTCREAKRPCLYVSCRYHLYLDVNPSTGSIKLNFPDKQVWELEESCALDVAERGGVTLEEVGAIMNLTRERIRQVEVSGLGKLREDDGSLETFVDGRELKGIEGRDAALERLPIVDA